MTIVSSCPMRQTFDEILILSSSSYTFCSLHHIWLYCLFISKRNKHFKTCLRGIYNQGSITSNCIFKQVYTQFLPVGIKNKQLQWKTIYLLKFVIVFIYTKLKDFFNKLFCRIKAKWAYLSHCQTSKIHISIVT